MRIRENKPINISYLEDASFDCSGALWVIKCLPWLETSWGEKTGNIG